MSQGQTQKIVHSLDQSNSTQNQPNHTNLQECVNSVQNNTEINNKSLDKMRRKIVSNKKSKINKLNKRIKKRKKFSMINRFHRNSMISDLASVNEKDFLSDNQPPKDIVLERKLLHKEKKLHIFKTIIRVGKGIDKPAPYDEIRLRYRNQPKSDSEGLQQARNYSFIQKEEFMTYNLGLKNFQIERLVTSMKEGQTAFFELDQLQVSKKSNIKVLRNKIVYMVEVDKWTTVIDIDGNKEILKYLLRRGQGAWRVSKYDEITFNASITFKGVTVLQRNEKLLKIQQETIKQMQPILWKVLTTMKKNELAKVTLNDYNMKVISAIWQKKPKQIQPNNEQPSQNNKTEQQKDKNKDKDKEEQFQQVANLCRYEQLIKVYENKQLEMNQPKEQMKQEQKEEIKEWTVSIEIFDLISVDDIYMDGTLIKKLLWKGVSTAKPDSSSYIYYALKYLDSNKNVLHQDACFNSDWWEDFGKLQVLGCRKNYMDDYKMSQFLKACMKRMKPAQVSEIQCRNLQYFKFGHDFQQLKSLWPKDQQFPPKRVNMIVRVYNFTQGKNTFNMQIAQKVQQSKRKRQIAVKLLNEGNIQKAFEKFQNIVSYYNSGDNIQEGYDQKISALMNSILCLMKQNKFAEMIPLCNIVLEKPKHGFNPDKMSIKAQGIKVQGKVQNSGQDQMGRRQAIQLKQNPKIIQKCLYRKAFALLKTGESRQAIQFLDKIQNQSQQVKILRGEAEKHLQNYEQKTIKMFKSMFGV